MSLRSVGPDLLPGLQPFQKEDDMRPEKKGYEKGGHRGVGGTEGYILKYIEGREILYQRIEKFLKHLSP
jgi:hypothetical protein